MEETITIQTQSTLFLTLTHPVQGGADEAGPSSGKKRASEPGRKDGQSKKPRLTEEDGDITLHVDHQAKVVDISMDGNFQSIHGGCENSCKFIVWKFSKADRNSCHLLQSAAHS